MTYAISLLALAAIVVVACIVAGMDIATRDHDDVKPRKKDPHDHL